LKAHRAGSGPDPLAVPDSPCSQGPVTQIVPHVHYVQSRPLEATVTSRVPPQIGPNTPLPATGPIGPEFGHATSANHTDRTHFSRVTEPADAIVRSRSKTTPRGPTIFGLTPGFGPPSFSSACHVGTAGPVTQGPVLFDTGSRAPQCRALARVDDRTHPLRVCVTPEVFATSQAVSLSSNMVD
jgi:hypothetical protein